MDNSPAKSLRALSPGVEGESQELAPPLGITNTSNILEVGMEYKLDYKDGTSRITIWDGTNFRIKSQFCLNSSRLGKFISNIGPYISWLSKFLID